MFLAGSCLSRCLAKENSDWVVRINSIPARQRRALEVCAGPNRQPERARKQQVMRSESGCAERPQLWSSSAGQEEQKHHQKGMSGASGEKRLNPYLSRNLL